MRFAIFTHVQHTERKEQFYAYAPYVREMNLWLKQVEEVEVVAPAPLPIAIGAKGELKGQDPYIHRDFIFTRIPSFSFLNLAGSVNAILKIPVGIFKIMGAMKRADHLHLRCPGNIGLLACICQIFFPKKPKTAKYAGNWDPQAKQPWTYNLQKWILSNRFLTRNMRVLVYGKWRGQSKNIIPFFTASFAEREIGKVKEKDFKGPLTFLFVGNLVPGKHPLKAIQLVQEIWDRRELYGEKPKIFLEIYGDGPERKMLEIYCKEEKLEGLVHFKGSRPLEELKEAYRKAHFVILPSQSEGWPKAIAESMFFGCIPIATPISCVPWMLEYGERGVLLEQLDQRPKAKRQQPERRGQRAEGAGQEPDLPYFSSDAEKVIELLRDTDEMQRKSRAAKEWSQRYTLEKFETAIGNVLALQSQKRE